MILGQISICAVSWSKKLPAESRPCSVCRVRKSRNATLWQPLATGVQDPVWPNQTGLLHCAQTPSCLHIEQQGAVNGLIGFVESSS